MGPFLAGFCSELTKTAFADQRTPTPVPASGAPTTQRPTGAAAAPPRPAQSTQSMQRWNSTAKPITGPVQGAIGGAPKQDLWRPSPKYTPKPDATASQPDATKRGGGRKKPVGPGWQYTRQDSPGGGGQKQVKDTRSPQEIAWGKLPKAQKPATMGEGYANRPDIPLPAGSDPRMRGNVRTGQGGSHIADARPAATVHDIVNKRTGGHGAGYSQQGIDLHNGQRAWTASERFMDQQKNNPTGANQFAGAPKFNTRQFAATLKPAKRQPTASGGGESPQGIDRWEGVE